jgi:acylpyruvate hydrolase
MKYLSMRVGDEDRAAIVVGDQALDVTAYCKVAEATDATCQIHLPLIDALDLHGLGREALQDIVSRVENDTALADRCRQAGALLPLDSVKLNPPVLAPGKILAVGLNYAAHAAEQNKKPPETPLIFTKNVTALLGPNQEIQLPRISQMIDYEAELAVVIGRDAKSVSAQRAYEYIAGYTIMNDVTARDLQNRERQWSRAKGLDTFAPCGPWLVTADEIPDPHVLDIELRLNGELRQRSNTNDLIFKIPQLIEFISQDLTLRRGDIISTGTPSGVGIFMTPPVFLRDGDRIEINLARIGSLRNTVRGN